jgi:hypothetical protein
VNPDEPRSREESEEEENSPLFFRYRRKMKIGGGILFAVLALWLNSLTSVVSKPPAAAHAAPQATPTFFDGFAIISILTIVAVVLAFAAFRGRLGFLPGVVAFAALVGAALAVCYYR